MREELAEVRLKTGETLKVMVVEAPDDEHAGTVLNLLSHKGEMRQWQFVEDFAGRAPGLRSRYYLGFIEGRAVANISVWESGPAGNLGHVHTLEAHRRKGICKAVMGAQMDDFRARGGELIVLGTGYDGHPYHIYRSFGFESMVPGSGAMVYVGNRAFYEEHYRSGAVTCGAAEWRDLGWVCALMASPDGDWLRSRGSSKLGPNCYEGAFVQDMHGVRQGERQTRVARLANGAVVGYAALRTGCDWEERVSLLDLFALPEFSGCAAELVEGLEWPSGPTHCYVDAGSALRETLQASGFGEAGCLAGVMQRADGAAADAVLLSR